MLNLKIKIQVETSNIQLYNAGNDQHFYGISIIAKCSNILEFININLTLFYLKNDTFIIQENIFFFTNQIHDLNQRLFHNSIF